jgi:hypothetical protein
MLTQRLWQGTKLVNFSKEMDASSIIISTSYSKQAGVAVSGTVYSGTTATFVPAAVLAKHPNIATQPREQSADTVALAATMQEFTTTANYQQAQRALGSW